MESIAATRLADQLRSHQQELCNEVASRLLVAYPELKRSLRLEENYLPITRLSEVAVERLNELVRAVLIFELPSLADQELLWAHGVLPRNGVTAEHQSSMVSWFFEEVRKLPISAAEIAITREIEQYFLVQIRHPHHKSS
ncbi:hypothetical protein K2Z83_16435 [Oscillochloris sp. ZM17-4]|uniref:hypothetical protein n=1 Tax=Oscillochloris sp. ZM17-4 TaxID=2866714 RepID=UPI001C732B86|nr:hypothetical protein [Oscillochloris sp. ZM17-4]MBX0329263.1 hypothetical protein [Oscillochloris sp. ZM17-4]